MPGYALIFGGLLTILGVIAYTAPDLLGGGKPYQISALSPAFIGGPILLAGLLSLLAPNARKHAMHAAAVFALLGTVGGIVPVILRRFDLAETAVKVGLGMTVLSAIFLVLCVNSFIQARRARAATTPS
jgi:hypothetical protein